MGSITDLITTLGKNASIAAKTLRAPQRKPKITHSLTPPVKLIKTAKIFLKPISKTLHMAKTMVWMMHYSIDSCSTMLDLMALSKA